MTDTCQPEERRACPESTPQIRMTLGTRNERLGRGQSLKGEPSRRDGFFVPQNDAAAALLPPSPFLLPAGGDGGGQCL